MVDSMDQSPFTLANCLNKGDSRDFLPIHFENSTEHGSPAVGQDSVIDPAFMSSMESKYNKEQSMTLRRLSCDRTKNLLSAEGLQNS